VKTEIKRYLAEREANPAWFDSAVARSAKEREAAVQADAAEA
jgi:hypothetical protein